ncbi:AEC family transporter [Flavobacterium sp. TAB 87]|uniref:AEC family transporter n=1 Tax=Flavobacterium sp. TAB 87 TaxID=1729581 RepID=UPI00076D33D7|nr:AEC family transporter [Flavobacterium sp. TAB 87]KVV14219.1 auxin efflux carrier [Flavobacterium sp. TAB 87]
MKNIIIIFVSLFLGIACQFVGRFPKEIYKTLNKIVLYFCLPALSLYFIPKIVWQNELLYPIGAAWISFALSIIFFASIGSYFRWSKKLTGCLIITGGFSNTSFLGFPIIEALYGKPGLETAILVDQPGGFVAMSTLGILVAIFYSSGSTTATLIAKKILLFPPFITFCIAVLMNVFEYDFLDNIQFGLLKVGSLVTPLALFSIGLQLSFDRKSKHFKFLTLGLVFKLILMPLFLLVLYVFILKQKGLQIEVSIMEMAMAPMITASILASAYGLKPKLCSLMIGVGIPLSFITLFFWCIILNFVK